LHVRFLALEIDADAVASQSGDRRSSGEQTALMAQSLTRSKAMP
jgi:hypothetical protein